MKFIPILIGLSLTIFVSCHTKKETPDFESMNEGTLVSAKEFLFSIPYSSSPGGGAVITAWINGKPKRFMIDTGAPLSISRSLQEELRFPVLYQAKLKDSNGDSTGVEIVGTTELGIGPLKFKNIPALVLDLDQPIFNCDSIDGLIGSNLLRLLVIQFNQPEQKIYFSNSSDQFNFDATTTSTGMVLNEVQSDPLITLRINGMIDDSILYDSGDKTLYTIASSQFDHFRKNSGLQQHIVATGTGAGSQGIVAKAKDEFSTFLLRIDSLSIGGSTINNVYTEPTPDTRSRMGRGLWEYGLVTMDYPRHQFYFTPYHKRSAMNPVADHGFRYQERNGKLIVTIVWNNSKAFDGGLRPGYEITRFGSFIPGKVPKCEWSTYCKKEEMVSGIPVTYLTTKGETKQCVVTRKIVDEEAK